MSNRPNKKKPSLRTEAARRAEEEAAAAARAQQRRQRMKATFAVIGLVALVVAAVLILFKPSSSEKTAAPKPSPDAVKLGCTACHTTDGSVSEGPTWKGLAGSNVTLTNGQTVLADARYLADAILNPQATTVQGYQPNAMPKKPVTDAELKRLIAYIQDLPA